VLRKSLKTEKLNLKVIDVTSDSYVLDIDAAITGSGNLYLILEGEPINMTLDLEIQN
jgi:hypothetical protein